ncbi:sensor domain-containing diguanylate cyclase [Oribacterium sp. WCC10]|uniref:sensor domain-containing diguanylate cyclase n=1 Tax=Oribacterium sp. WCC10 TaxID=1855343 RepID=UPI0008E48EEC|nr:diguanylate cyclase [Oribacterium sp. WCC10]SFG47319.1 diguanylate cyclase (GGDEF) domain-containing protein [Oribacterium sp. WCC10]
MKQIQTIYTNKEELRETLFEWKKELEKDNHKAIAHIFQRYDAMPESYPVYQEITGLFREILPDVAFAVFSGAGVIADQKITENSFTVTLTVFEDKNSDAEIRLLSMEDPETTKEILRKEIFTKPNLCGIEVISALTWEKMFSLMDVLDELPESISIFGGVAVSDDGCPSYVASSDDHSMIDAFLITTYCGTDLHIMTSRVNGWKHIGFPIKVTHSVEDVIYTLNDEPAYNIYKRYLKIPNDRNFFYNALEFPFEITEPNGDTYIRHAKSSTENGAIVMSSFVPEGSTVRFSYGDPEAIRQDVRAQVKATADFRPEVLIMCNCLGRKLFWGEDASIDISPFFTIAPMSGACFLGEILRYQGKTYLNNLSLVVVSMREGEITNHPECGYTDTDSGVLSLASRLASFINTMTGELQDANEQLTILLKQATTDALTGVYNRGEITRKIDECFLSSKCGKTWSLIMMDIDDFKQINDVYSHAEGDNVLKTATYVIQSTIERLHPAASLGRWGGEEFMILLPDINVQEASSFAEVLRIAVQEMQFKESRRISMSFGVTEYIPNEKIYDTLMRVDKALYMVKNSGKNAVKAL